MPSKLRQAIGAIKDQTSISIAKLSGSSDVDITILKATSHEEAPAEERYLTEVLLLSTSSTSAADDCVQALSRRISRTHNWVVALKVLLVVFRILRDGGSHIKHEALAEAPAHPGSHRRLLDLSDFRDGSSSSSPWDFTAFVRTLALYLDARLDSAIAGKINNLSCHPSVTRSGLACASPSWVFDRVVHWQQLLDRAIATRPTGPAKANRLVQIAFYLVVRETFFLYHNISDGLSLLLNDILRLRRGLCMEMFHACTKAKSQFEELEYFYKLCKSIGVGRNSEYPNIQKISEPMLKTLEEFSQEHRLESSPMSTSSFQKDKKLETVSSIRTTTDWEPDYCSLDTDYRLSNSESSKLIHKKEKIVEDKLMLYEEQHKASSDKPLQGWELALVEGIRNLETIRSEGVFESNQPQHTTYQRSFPSNGSTYCERSLRISSSSSWSTLAMHPPTFCAERPNEKTESEEDDPFSSSFHRRCPSELMDASTRQHLLLLEQQMWMQKQSKIIAKKMVY